jgi:release factor glutamine methyltransferase
MTTASSSAQERTLAALLLEAEAALVEAEVPSPRRDAELLLAHALDVEPAALPRLVVLGSRADEVRARAFGRLIQRRCTREPVQHLTGRAPFRHLELLVGPGVFVPRPETELVAGAVLDRLTAAPPSDRAPLVVDLCSGSGAIALAVVDEHPAAEVVAVEADDDAVLWLGRNVEALRGRSRVRVVHGDARSVTELLPELVGRVDVVATNPPYVPDDAVIRDPEVVAFDPAAALWGGPDGLDVIRDLVRQAEQLLRPGGLFVVEHADVQGESVPALLRERNGLAADAAWVGIADHLDLAGRPRFTTALRGGAV